MGEGEETQGSSSSTPQVNFTKVHETVGEVREARSGPNLKIL